MKIYNEITIDMNPESDTFEEVLSEDSCEWSGDVVLCKGSGSDVWNVAEDEYGAGYTAADRSGNGRCKHGAPVIDLLYFQSFPVFFEYLRLDAFAFGNDTLEGFGLNEIVMIHSECV